MPSDPKPNPERLHLLPHAQFAQDPQGVALEVMPEPAVAFQSALASMRSTVSPALAEQDGGGVAGRSAADDQDGAVVLMGSPLFLCCSG